MSGKYNGAQKKLSEKVEREITYILRGAHGANLVNEHSSKASVLISSMYDILEAIYVFFNASTKRCKVLTDLLQEVDNALQLTNLSKTRCKACPESIEAFWRSLETIIEALKALYSSKDADGDTKTKASGFLSRVLRFDTPPSPPP